MLGSLVFAYEQMRKIKCVPMVLRYFHYCLVVVGGGDGVWADLIEIGTREICQLGKSFGRQLMEHRTPLPV